MRILMFSLAQEAQPKIRRVHREGMCLMKCNNTPTPKPNPPPPSQPVNDWVRLVVWVPLLDCTFVCSSLGCLYLLCLGFFSSLFDFFSLLRCSLKDVIECKTSLIERYPSPGFLVPPPISDKTSFQHIFGLPPSCQNQNKVSWSEWDIN